MSGGDDNELDELILSFSTSRFKKVAMVLGQVLSHCRSHDIPITDDALADRLHDLVNAGKLEVQGNLFRWRRSEVRLPEQGRTNPTRPPTPGMRRYVIGVLAIFRANSNDPKEYDVWENLVVVRGEGPCRALTAAIAISRSVLDDTENLQALGYREKPCLYAVHSHHEDTDIPNAGPGSSEDHMTLTLLTSIDEEDFENFGAYKDLQLSLAAMYIDGHFD